MTMKKISIIVMVLMTAMSCNTLEVEPQNSIPADGAFQTKNDIDRGILGAYASFQSLGYYGRIYGIYSDLAADNLIHSPDATASDNAEVDNNNILPENGFVRGMWISCYDGINERNAALAELYFIRALNHFNLLNYFGAIPLKLQPTVGVTGLDAPRNSVNEVYAKIIEDLTFASVYLRSSGVKTRATKYAAKALLARVYLYKGDYAQAATLATEVID